jgi:hypothetical protein
MSDSEAAGERGKELVLSIRVNVKTCYRISLTFTHVYSLGDGKGSHLLVHQGRLLIPRPAIRGFRPIPLGDPAGRSTAAPAPLRANREPGF